MHHLICLKKTFSFIDFLERGRRGKEKEKYWFVVPLFYAFIGCFLYVHWLGIEPATLAYLDVALTNWATRSRPQRDWSYCFLPLKNRLFIKFNLLSWKNTTGTFHLSSQVHSQLLFFCPLKNTNFSLYSMSLWSCLELNIPTAIAKVLFLLREIKNTVRKLFCYIRDI